jgi:hypothetical protein
MPKRNRLALMAGCFLAALAGNCALADTLIIQDKYDVAGAGTGFAPNTGVNSGIVSAKTRLGGRAGAGVRYLPVFTNKPAAAYSLADKKLRVNAADKIGRFTCSVDGTNSLDLAPALGLAKATPAKPVVYDLTISMANQSAGIHRFSFAISTAMSAADDWDFGLQLYRKNKRDDFYTIGKRIDKSSTGLTVDLNEVMTTTSPGTVGSEIEFLIRVTDAGAETGEFSSRVQVSLDAGKSWFYDTLTDPNLADGWRLDGAARYVVWDVAPNAGPVTYDDFAVTLKTARRLAAPVPRKKTQARELVPVLPPAAGADFMIAVLPDTQNYARETAKLGQPVKEMWFAQTEWIINNRLTHNIAYVAHLGDIVQNGDIKQGAPNAIEWQNATNAMYRIEDRLRTMLEHGIPYGMSVGNHDQEPAREPDGASKFYNMYFGVDHFAGRSYYGGHFGSDNDNHFGFFSASGLDFIVLFFEFGRYDSNILSWANSVLATNQHRRAIVVTHNAGTPVTPCDFSLQGAALYEGLKTNNNFFLMLGGHVNGEGSRQDVFNGNTVHTFISDYQFRTNGGDGWMRMMYFSPSNNTVSIKTYSPWLDKYETDFNSEMSFHYDMQSPPQVASSGKSQAALRTEARVAPVRQNHSDDRIADQNE